MNSAQTIAQTLDRHLSQPTEVIVFGVGALLLDPKFAARLAGRSTNDVDIIIPKEKALQVDMDRSFWQALENTNRELQPRGLYVTHIFPEQEVVLTPEWIRHTVALRHDELTKLRLQRPRILDLVISKMGRGDLQDLEDVRSMLRLHREVSGTVVTAEQISLAALRAHVPEVYREIFPGACKRIVAVAREMGVRQDPPKQHPTVPPPGEPPRQGPRMGI